MKGLYKFFTLDIRYKKREFYEAYSNLIVLFLKLKFNSRLWLNTNSNAKNPFGVENVWVQPKKLFFFSFDRKINKNQFMNDNIEEKTEIIL
jgi:hypothetical protein